LARHVNYHVRVAALQALERRPMRVALVPLTDALGDDEFDVRNAAVEILGRAKDPESLKMVGQLLEKHTDRIVRVGAMRVMARRGDAEAAAHLSAFLEDSGIYRNDKEMRTIAQQMLDELDRRARDKQAAGR
jgi:HEAT repeat protein